MSEPTHEERITALEARWAEFDDTLAAILEVAFPYQPLPDDPDQIDADVSDWVPVTGAHNAVFPKRLVRFSGEVYRNIAGVPLAHSPAEYPQGYEQLTGLPDPNVTQPWEPWTSGLNEDLYQIGDQVTHNGQTWEATVGNNHWEPGVFGWVVLP